MTKIVLTDARIKALPATGKRYCVYDALVPGLLVFVGAEGGKSFRLLARYPGKASPERRQIGRLGEELDAVRNRARKWLSLIRKGIDPRDQEEQEQRAERLRLEAARKAEEQRRAHTFRAVAEAYVASRSQKLWKGTQVARYERQIERNLTRVWGDRPITEITADDVEALIRSKAATPREAGIAFKHARALFNWALRKRYGLAGNPCNAVDVDELPADLAGQKRERPLSEDELDRLWEIVGDEGYPFGSCLRLIILTGVRKEEASKARWSEFDLAEKVWSVPAERCKNGLGHRVPLSEAAIALLESLPRHCAFVFSADRRYPVSGWTKAKKRLDRALGAERWTIHDLRHTVATGLEKLEVPPHVIAMVMNHSKGAIAGITGRYSHHSYLNEKRRALDAWARRLTGEPAPDNVVALAS